MLLTTSPITGPISASAVAKGLKVLQHGLHISTPQGNLVIRNSGLLDTLTYQGRVTFHVNSPSTETSTTVEGEGLQISNRYITGINVQWPIMTTTTSVNCKVRGGSGELRVSHT